MHTTGRHHEFHSYFQEYHSYLQREDRWIYSWQRSSRWHVAGICRGRNPSSSYIRHKPFTPLSIHVSVISYSPYFPNYIPPKNFRYLCNALDKGNVGNAKTDGWDTVRSITSAQPLLDSSVATPFRISTFQGIRCALFDTDLELTVEMPVVQYYLLVMIFYVSRLHSGYVR